MEGILMGSIVSDACVVAELAVAPMARHGQARGGAVSAVVDGSGQLVELTIARDALRYDRRGNVDLALLAGDILDAANEALTAQLSARTSDRLV
jgi:DNA-binding protein YbaB